MQVEVLNHQGKGTGRSVDLPEDIFGVEPNEHAVYLAVKQYLAAQRQGTHKVKGRSEVQGSTRKLHRQKGTGGSRKGNIRNPLYKGGGAVHGPEPRSYRFKLNKKVKDLARASALSQKANQEKVKVVEDITLDAPKTKDIITILSALGLQDEKILLVQEGGNFELALSTRNLSNVLTIDLAQTNTYDVMNSAIILFTESAMNLLNQEEEVEEPA